MNHIVGEIEYIDRRVVSGWAYVHGRAGVVTAAFYMDGFEIGEKPADILRQDIANRGVSDGWCGWFFRVPEGVTFDAQHGIVVQLNAEGCEPLRLIKEVFFDKTEVQSYIDHVRLSHVYGWAKFKGDDETRVSVRLVCDEQVISCATANLFRGEISDAGIGDGGYGFVLPVPLDRRLTPTEASVAVMDGDRLRHIQNVFLDRSDVRILIVTDTAHEDNASRYYRALLQSNLLWQSGAEVEIIDRTEVKVGSFENFSVIILQRAPANDIIVQECLNARWRQTLILYETDDLNTSPDLVEKTGAVRSGFRSPSDGSFMQEMEGRITSSNLADAILVPNRFMEWFYRSRGYHTILSPFKCANVSVLKKRDRSPDSTWKILYYSGSPTHRADFALFKESIIRFLNENKNAKFTVLGHVERNDFAGIPRTIFKGATSYEGLLNVIDEHDCVVAPFEKSAYNYGKSCTKFLESAARGVPLIVSKLPDYASHIKNSGFGSLVERPDQWAEKLKLEYERRNEVFARSAELCAYARREFSLQEAGTEVLGRIFAEYNRAVCRAL